MIGPNQMERPNERTAVVLRGLSIEEGESKEKKKLNWYFDYTKGLALDRLLSCRRQEAVTTIRANKINRRGGTMTRVTDPIHVRLGQYEHPQTTELHQSSATFS